MPKVIGAQLSALRRVDMKIDHYIVYCLVFFRGGEKFEYVGLTGVLEKQSDRVALELRKKYHLHFGKAWVKGGVSLAMRVLVTGLKSMSAALKAEARETVRRLYAFGFAKASGSGINNHRFLSFFEGRSSNTFFFVSPCAYNSRYEEDPGVASDCPMRILWRFMN